MAKRNLKPTSVGVEGTSYSKVVSSPDLFIGKTGVKFTREQRKLNPVGSYTMQRCDRVATYTPDYQAPSCDNLPINWFGVMLNGIDLADLETGCYEKLVTDLKSCGSFNSLVFAKEFSSSVDMILSRVVQFQRGIRALRSGRPSRIRAFLVEMSNSPRVTRDGPSGKRIFVPKRLSVHKTLADNWLEYSFGFKPLIEDCGEILKLLTTSRDDTYTSVVTKMVTFSEQSPPEDTFSSSARTVTGVLRYQCDIKVTNPNIHLANNVGVLNPLEAVYEIIPFSFAVDYFVNLGQMISSLSAFAGIEFLSCQRMLLLKGEYHASVPLLGFDAKYNTVSMERSIAAPPRPTLSFSNPITGPMRAANQIAVLVSLLKK